MKKILTVLAALALAGCHSRGMDKVLGKEHKGAQAERVNQFYVVACCQDNNGGVLTYPSFLPASHVQLCQTANAACHNADCQINGDTYLPVHGDCGHHGYVGDQYYPPTGY